MNLMGEPAYVGRHCGSHQYDITREVVDFYADALDDGNDFSQWAPPLIHHSECYTVLGQWYLKNLFGNLHARQDWELFAPIPVGAHVSTRSTIVDRYSKRGRDYVVNETDILDRESGQLYVRGRTHQSFLPPKQDGGEGGFVVDEKTAAKKARPKPELPAGEPFGTSTKHIDKRRCWMFSGPGANYHTDEEQAKKLGFPTIVVQGMMTTCFPAELMQQRFGEGFLRGGRMSLKLTNVVWVGDTLTARAWEREQEPEGTQTRVHCDVVVEKEEGVPVLVGTASALV
ncbi:MAG: MaoC/PaaZ C-terminal domain-containing protein [Myxococcota bacterium]|nr:MaoC/PaaZ C-terminal domain-containing protein [Myxococcota bacterium]